MVDTILFLELEQLALELDIDVWDLTIEELIILLKETQLI